MQSYYIRKYAKKFMLAAFLLLSLYSIFHSLGR
jgi:hypothetical protein